MKTRILTGMVALAIFLPFLIFSGTFAFGFAMAVCCLVSVFEMLRCVGVHKNPAVSIPMMLVAFSLPGCVYFVDGLEQFMQIAIPTVLLMMLWLLAVSVFSLGAFDIANISSAAFLCFYIISAYSSILFLRYYEETGAYTYLLIFIGAWVSDSFAYFCGVFFGKHKLIPEISPKKTIEGSVGGIVFCALGFVLYGVILKHGLAMSVDFHYWRLIVYGVAVSVVSQIGDLAMSAVKRHYNIKDFGKIFPGHGGMLDRFDSILAVSVVLFVLNEFSGVFTKGL